MELQKKIEKMHVIRKGGESYDFARAAVRDSLRPAHEGPALRAEQAAAQLRPSPAAGVKRVPTPPKPKPAPKAAPPTGSGAIPSAPAEATEAAIQEAAAPEVAPGSSADGASPAVPFHKEGL